MLGYVCKLKVKRLYILLVFLGSAYFICQWLFFAFYIHGGDSHYPVIIWWTPFMVGDQRTVSCYSEKYNCLIMPNKNYTGTNLQAFLFYGTNFNSTDVPLPKNKIWALFHEESPRNAAIFLYQRTFQAFDITSTFSRNSDFSLTLQYLENLTMLTDLRFFVKVQEKNKLLGEIAPVLYIQSDCDTPWERDQYVKELMEYIKVDSYGACLKNREFPKEMNGAEQGDIYNFNLLKLISQYKFIISFENAFCEDYITEKLWRPLIVGSIPIYWGSPSVMCFHKQDWLPNNNSAILAEHFSPKELATHIKKINADDTLYDSLRAHKFGRIDNILLKNTLEKGLCGLETDQENIIQAFECFVCKSIFEGVKIKNSGPVYDCKPPEKGRWSHFWLSGLYESMMFMDFINSSKK